LYTDIITTALSAGTNIAFDVPSLMIDSAATSGTAWTLDAVASKLYFKTAGNPAGIVVIDDVNDRVGIGTAAPVEKLHVVDAAGNTAIQLNSGLYAGQIGVASGAGDFASFATAGDVIVRSMTSSRDLILKAAPDGAIRFGTDGAGPESEKVTITPDGNVGINDVNPSQTLSVNGNSLFSGTLGVGVPTVSSKFQVAGSASRVR